MNNTRPKLIRQLYVRPKHYVWKLDVEHSIYTFEIHKQNHGRQPSWYHSDTKQFSAFVRFKKGRDNKFYDSFYSKEEAKKYLIQKYKENQ